MKVLILLFVLLSFNVSAQVSFNASGKTLDQFFAMSAEIMNKAIVVDPAINSNIKIYGTTYSDSFNQLFYSLLSAYDLSFIETDSLIKVIKNKVVSNSNAESLVNYISSVVNGIYIDGSLMFKRNNKIGYHYSFVKSGTNEVFDPHSLGLRVTSVNACLVKLSISDFSTIITCKPFSDSFGSDVSNSEDDIVNSIVSESGVSESGVSESGVSESGVSESGSE